MNKNCAACQTSKPLDEFNNCAKGKYGKQAYCRECSKAKVKKWSRDNREHVYEYNETYRQKNPEKTREWQRKYHRNWYLKNREDKLRQNAEWYRNNPSHVSRKNALRRGTRQIDTDKVELELLRARDVDCYLCGLEIQYDLKWPDLSSPSVDHIVPISRGGPHKYDNLAFTHLGCNLSKGDKIING